MNDLEGLTVVSLEQAVAAPYASMKLADAGARVIKIERKEGDFARNYDNLVNGGSAYFVWLNRGKQSICLDIKQDQDLGLLKSMLAKADIFIQNLVPGSVERMGLDAQSLHQANPGLIICSISGYGTSGPAKMQKAYDLLIQAESGLCAINGTPEGPARVGVSVCDISAGMTAYQALLEALIGRATSGKGRAIEVSLFHSMADWMNVPYLQYRYGGKPASRQGLKHPTIAPYGAYDCQDGKVLLISIQNEREWKNLCERVIGNAAMATDEKFLSNTRRCQNREELDGLVQLFFSQRTRDENIELLHAAGIAFGRLSDLDDLIAHPQSRFVEIRTEHGPVEVLGPGSIVRDNNPSFDPVPALDEHGEMIRQEFS